MDGHQALAEAFSEWVDGHGWTQTEVVMMGGPSTSTQTKVRQGHGPYRSATLRQIDKVMGWHPGTAQKVVRGTPPPPGSLEKSAENVVADSDTGDSLLFRRPDGISDQEWSVVRARMGTGWEWELRQAHLER